MAPKSSVEHRSSSMPGLWKYPSFRDDILKSDLKWLKGRQLDDGAEGFWRIHDSLYDFSKFIFTHPGGSEWLLLTKGTDITEAFESHHISSVPRNMLDKFKIKEATTPRNSPYTFHPQGFYSTLRKGIIEKLPEIIKYHGPSPQSCHMIDFLMIVALLFSLVAAKFQSVAVAIIAGVILSLASASSHNFVHLRPTWRRNYMRMMLFSPKHYTIIHILSHHLYPNSLHDLELSLYEPHLRWLPNKKGWLAYYSWIASPFVYMLVAPSEYLKIILTFGLELQDLTPLCLPFAMIIVNNSVNIGYTVLLWAVIMFTASFWFQACGLNAGHHHPNIFHDGDAARVDRDWGLAMVDSVRDRTLISGVTGSYTKDKDGKLKVHIDFKPSLLQFFLTLTNYGHHVLHHLFPTLDHYYLPQIYPILEETLQEFGEIYETSSMTEQIKGQFQQLIRSIPNTIPPGFNK